VPRAFTHSYRKREKQLAYALQNTPLSMLENSLVEMENEMAQMSPFDGENSMYDPRPPPALCGALHSS
jgi:hypothetical protein